MQRTYFREFNHNCTNCAFAKAHKVCGSNPKILLICDNKNAKEYQNMVDKYIHCGRWRKEQNND